MTMLSADAPTVPTASLRERKKLATRRALRRAAVSLVSDRGLGAVTVEDIAAKAEVSPRTFFNYFSSKEDAISGIDPDFVAETVEQLQLRLPDEAGPVALRAALLATTAAPGADHRDLAKRLRLIRSNPHLLAHYVSAWAELERQLVAALADRRCTDPAEDRYVSLVVATHLTAARVAQMSWCGREGRVPFEDELALHLDLLATGLAEPVDPVDPADPADPADPVRKKRRSSR